MCIHSNFSLTKTTIMGKRILIVEDNEMIAENLCDLLEMSGYEPCPAAASYHEALSIFNSHKPDLAILDINLQGNQTGIDVACFLRENSTIPFIYHSAAIEIEIKEMALATNPYAFFAKPVDFNTLKSTLESALTPEPKAIKGNILGIAKLSTWVSADTPLLNG